VEFFNKKLILSAPKGEGIFQRRSKLSVRGIEVSKRKCAYFTYEEGISMDVKSVGDVKIPVIIPRVDAHTAKEVEANLNDLVNGGNKRIVCDFSQNDYISSAGLRVFLQMLKIMQKSGGKIALCSLKPQVKEVFDMAGFSQLFRIFDTEEEAIKEL